MTWVPALHLGHDAWVGLLGDDVFVGDVDGPVRDVDPGEPTGLLPCLERPYSVIVAELQEREVELSLRPGTLIGRMPFAGIPHAAVAARSDYWAGLAFDWLDAMPRSERVSSTLERLENAGWASQSVRHRARRLRRG